MIRGHAVRALSCIPGAARIADLRIASLDSDTGVRRAAARSLAELADQAPAEMLSALAADADSGVRHTAIRALGRLPGTEAVLEALMSGAQDQMSRIEAAAALFERGDTTGFDILFDALTTPSARRAREALVTRPSRGPRLLARLSDTDPRARGWAAWVLGRSGVAAAPTLAALRPLLSDQDPTTRLVALDALSRLGDEESVVGMAGTMSGSGDALVDTARALARFDSPAACAILADIAASTAAPPTARRWAARALAMSSSPAAAPALRSLEQSEVLRVRRLAAAGLDHR